VERKRGGVGKSYQRKKGGGGGEYSIQNILRISQ
jgi:hypothetical protein